uniref:Uncharacterized protein n=1 Tax=Oryza sativa subsp. japonica TaxID=39947 RepID=Q6Z8M6_ORYSJ|nr:hypothetical protein [Oryza sativa Japonica Group]
MLDEDHVNTSTLVPHQRNRPLKLPTQGYLGLRPDLRKEAAQPTQIGSHLQGESAA